MLTVYHGTITSCAKNIIEHGIILKKGKRKVDFGQGFYTTKSSKFAKSTAKNKAQKTNLHYGREIVKPVVLKFYVDESILNTLNVLQFNTEDICWAQFIINNRNGFDYMNNVGTHFHNIKRKYDVVIGAIADNQISLLAKNLDIMHSKVDVSDLSYMKYSYRTNQISFHTEKSLSCLQLINCDIILPNKKKGDVTNE